MESALTAQPLPPDSAPAEPPLVARLKQGEGRAFEELVREFGPQMIGVIRRFLPGEQDSQDALQDAFISVFRAIGRFQGESSLGTWLHRIAVNAALMRIRAQQRRKERPIEDLLPKYCEDGHRDQTREGWAVTHDTAVADNEIKELVRNSIEKLPESYRAILLLRDIEERSTEETAELLELSVPNVKTRLHRARQALRELLDERLGARS